MPEAPQHPEHAWSDGPASYIRPIALVLVRREDGAILVAPGYDTVKRQRFYRPLGGGIEFGELAADAAKRELREELGAELADLHLLGTFENIFTYQGHQGHELIWLFEARFTDASLYERDVVVADESGSKFEVHWVPVETLRRGDAALYPDGLAAMISQSS